MSFKTDLSYNRFVSSYVQGILDISGGVVLRNGSDIYLEDTDHSVRDLLYTNLSAVNLLMGNTILYDSLWFVVSNNTSYTLNHNTNMNILKPYQYKLLYSPINNPVMGTNNIYDVGNHNYNSGYDNGASLMFKSNNQIIIRTGVSHVALYHNGTLYNSASSGYYRLYLYSPDIGKGDTGPQGVPGPSYDATNTHFYKYENNLFTGNTIVPQYNVIARTFSAMGGDISMNYSTYLYGNIITRDTSNNITLGDSNDITYISGNVSLGKTTNSYTLDVSGNMHITGDIIKNGVSYATSNLTSGSMIIYDSGWFSATNNATYTLTHNQNINISKPLTYKLLFSTVNNPVIGTNRIYDITAKYYDANYANGHSLSIVNANQLALRTGGTNIALYHNGTSYAASSTGFCRLYLYNPDIAKGETGEQGIAGPSYDPMSVHFYKSGNVLYTGSSIIPSYSIVATSFSSLSDRKFKRNIENLGDKTTRFLEPKRYENIITGKKEIGLIAQDVQLLYPEIVETNIQDDEEFLSINYIQLIPIMIRDIEELRKKVEFLIKKK